MAYVVMISEERLKRLTSIHANVEPDELIPFVIQAQDLKVQSILGTKFYNNLKDSIADDSLTTEDEDLLNEYIAPFIAQYALYYALPSLNYKVTNKAVLNPSSEESLNADLEQLKYLRQSVRDTAEFYESRLRDYLCDFSTYFPDYVNAGTTGMMPSPSKKSTSGIFTPITVNYRPNGYDFPNDMK